MIATDSVHVSMTHFSIEVLAPGATLQFASGCGIASGCGCCAVPAVPAPSQSAPWLDGLMVIGGGRLCARLRESG